jgi:hypothetical protein
MSQGLWTVNNYPSTATAATVTQPAAGGSLVNRARHITFSASGAAAAATGILECVVRDGATGTGAIIWSGTLSSLAAESSSLVVPWIDLRASKGNALTAEFTGAGAAGTQLSVSMMGDLVEVGKPGWFA